MYVKELDKILTMKVLENTPAVLSLGKLCDENGYSCEWTNGQKPHLIKNGIRIQCNTENIVPIVVPGLSTSSSSSSHPSISMTPSRQERHRATSSSRCQSGPSAGNSFDPKEGRFSKDYGAHQQRLQISELHFDKFPIPTAFACVKIRFKTVVCT